MALISDSKSIFPWLPKPSISLFIQTDQYFTMMNFITVHPLYTSPFGLKVVWISDHEVQIILNASINNTITPFLYF